MTKGVIEVVPSSINGKFMITALQNTSSHLCHVLEWPPSVIVEYSKRHLKSEFPRALETKFYGDEIRSKNQKKSFHESTPLGLEPRPPKGYDF
jgi:hypothetical protein